MYGRQAGAPGGASEYWSGKIFQWKSNLFRVEILVPIFFISDKHQSCTKKINFLSKKAESFQRSKSSKAVKRKVCSFCELRAWWKTSQGPLLTKIQSFQRSEVSKALKSRLCSFCELPSWWKISQGPLFTAFEVSDLWKHYVFVKREPWLVFTKHAALKMSKICFLELLKLLQSIEKTPFLSKEVLD